jgi:hypothetical protein
MNAQMSGGDGIVVSLDISTTDVVPLREADAIESICELWISTNFFSKDIDIGIHVQEEA